MTAPDLQVYKPSPETDLLLLRWWNTLVETGDLEPTFGAGAMTLTKWLALFDPTKAVFVYGADADGIWLGALCAPVMGMACLAVWLRADQRQTKQGLAAMSAAYTAILGQFGQVIGVTRRALLGVHTAWGYRTVGCIPGGADGADAWIVSMTKAQFVERHPEAAAVLGNGHDVGGHVG